jgi:hypothetical protein
MDRNVIKRKQLELLGGAGAGILGAGVALLFARWLQPYALPALVIGIVTHGWAMFAKGRLERRAHEGQPRWAVAAEWLCWLMITALIVYVALPLLLRRPA